MKTFKEFKEENLNDMQRLNIEAPLLRALESVSWLKELTPTQKEFAVDIFRKFVSEL